MSPKIKEKITFWLSNTYTALVIAGIIIGMIYYPVNKRFQACEIATGELKTSLAKHYNEHKTKDEIIVELSAEIRVLNSLIEKMEQQFLACQAEYKTLSDRLYNLILKDN